MKIKIEYRNESPPFCIKRLHHIGHVEDFKFDKHLYISSNANTVYGFGYMIKVTKVFQTRSEANQYLKKYSKIDYF